jgi:HK97 gp10 family phage protein
VAKLIWKGDEVARKVIDSSRQAIDETNEAAAVLAKGTAPARTHELEQSVETEPARQEGPLLVGRLVARARHSLFVELGTVFMRAQPFLRPSADQENRKLASRIKAKLR